MKKNTRAILLILLGAFISFLSCEDTTSSENPVPGKVHLIDKSPDTVTVETGIDAEYIVGSVPPRDGIIIQWHPVQDNDLTGYRVYRSTSDSLTAFAMIATVRTQSVPGRVDTSYFDKSAIAGTLTRYYYRVSAEDAEQEGPRSRSDYYTLEEICIPRIPNISTNFDGTFQWESPTNHTGNFIFRLSKQTLESVGVRELHDIYTHEVSLSELGLDSLDAGNYQWRIDMIGNDENSGSESDWLSFSVP